MDTRKILILAVNPKDTTNPDGQTIASASSDQTVKLWDRNPESLMAWSCNWLRDYLLNNPDG